MAARVDTPVGALPAAGGPACCPPSGFSAQANRVWDMGSAAVQCHAAGEMLSDGTGTGSTQYTWNAEGRMATVTPYGGATATYVYDGDGHRVEDTTEQRLYWYGVDGKLQGETDGGSVNVQWIYFDGRRISKFNMAPAGPWGADFYDDAIGSLRLETDGYGNPNCRSDYYPFGEPVGSGCSLYESFQYAGLYTDAGQEDGGYSATRRRYSNIYYRWFSPDPGGMKVVSLTNPQTWNMYAYAGDNPTSLNDPSGMNACSPNDKSQSDCNVKIVIADRSKDKNGNYNDQFTNVKNEQNYNATAKVLVNGKLKDTYLIKTTPSSSKYATIKAGTYTGTFKIHGGKYPYAAILLSSKRYGYGKVPALGGLDPLTNKPYIHLAEIHRAGIHNYTGMPVSEGCSVVATCQYPSFESVTGLNAPAPQMDFTIMIGASANGGDQ